MAVTQKLFLCLGFIGLVSSVPVQAQEQISPKLSDPVATALDKRIEGYPKQGKGRIVFYRVSRHADGYGSSCTIAEELEGGATKMPNIKGNSFLVVEAEPGIHRYAVKIETTDRLTLEVEEGETYFVQCVMAHGILRPRPDIRPSTLEEFSSFPTLKPMKLQN
jgi:hypothetical protein